MRTRVEALKQIENGTFDLCVIGGGATGSGCALDAQLRGLRTVLLDSADFASGTSSASTKMAHGGVRYLQQGQFHVVKRALRERIHMLRNCPQLVRSQEFLIPCYSHWQRLYYGVGMKLYDAISGKANLAPSRILSRDEALRRMPALKSEGLTGAVSYADGQFQDARYCLALVQTFTECGGEALNYAAVVGLEKNIAHVEDRTTGHRFTVNARAFVNAAGPYSDRIRHLANPSSKPRLRLSKGAHILFPLEAVWGIDALLVPKTDDGRVIFAIPWNGRLLIGTTDDEATLEDEMLVTRDETEFLLRQINRYLTEPLSNDQVVSAFAGLRPLIASSGATKKLARDHEIETDQSTGLISILGGKWTTYRAMAEDTINAVERQLGRAITPCRTRDYPLTLADDYAMAATIEDVLARRTGLQFYGWKEAMEAAPGVSEQLAAKLGWSQAQRIKALNAYVAKLMLCAINN